MVNQSMLIKFSLITTDFVEALLKQHLLLIFGTQQNFKVFLCS